VRAHPTFRRLAPLLSLAVAVAVAVAPGAADGPTTVVLHMAAVDLLKRWLGALWYGMEDALVDGLEVTFWFTE